MAATPHLHLELAQIRKAGLNVRKPLHTQLHKFAALGWSSAPPSPKVVMRRLIALAEAELFLDRGVREDAPGEQDLRGIPRRGVLVVLPTVAWASGGPWTLYKKAPGAGRGLGSLGRELSMRPPSSKIC